MQLHPTDLRLNKNTRIYRNYRSSLLIVQESTTNFIGSSWTKASLLALAFLHSFSVVQGMWNGWKKLDKPVHESLGFFFKFQTFWNSLGRIFWGFQCAFAGVIDTWTYTYMIRFTVNCLHIPKKPWLNWTCVRVSNNAFFWNSNANSSIYVYDFYGVNMVKSVKKSLAAYSSTFSMYYIVSDWSDDCGEL